jgi:sialate O-acetylesterase
MRLIPTLIVTLGLVSSSLAAVKVNALFQNNMVLPQRTDVPIWGTATPGELITVQGSWGALKVTTALADGTWRVNLLTPRASASETVEIRGTNLLQFTNVAVGEVWMVCGQSNMEKTLLPTPGVPDVKNAAAEIAAANWPNVRLLHLGRTTSAVPQSQIKGLWEVCTPATVGKFSAIGYFFGRNLHQDMNVPVGIISAVKGGTSVEEWMSSAAQIASGSSVIPSTSYYNGMIAPIMPFPIRGALIYSGEGNVSRPLEMANVWRTWITPWRQEWGIPTLPIYYAQLAPYNYTGVRKGGSALTREGQADALSLPNTGMVTLSDTVDNINEIHPIDKQTAARRFNLMAAGRYYKRTGVVSSGPLFERITIENGYLRVYFVNHNNSLNSPLAELPAFEIAGADQVYFPARAIIERNAVSVSSLSVPKPMYVRMAWSDAAIPALFNGYGLPAAPFRSDRN